MVFVVAALLLQLSAVTPGSSTDSDLGSIRAAETRATDSNSGDATAAHGTGGSTSLKTVALDAPPDFQSLSTIRIPEMNRDKQEVIRPAETSPRRSWLLLSLAQHGAAGFDSYATRYAVGHGAVEDDPLLRPFAHSPSIYIVSQVAPTVLDLVGRRLERGQNSFIRRMWWLPQSMSTAVFLFSGVHDLHVANQR
jgi:hypothetical protein